MNKKKKNIIAIALIVAGVFLFLYVRSEKNPTRKMDNAFSIYEIVVGSSYVELSSKVNTEITYGYQPIGGVATKGSSFYQAMGK